MKRLSQAMMLVLLVAGESWVGGESWAQSGVNLPAKPEEGASSRKPALSSMVSGPWVDGWAGSDPSAGTPEPLVSAYVETPLPESPGAFRMREPEAPQEDKTRRTVRPCASSGQSVSHNSETVSPENIHMPCTEQTTNPYRRFLDSSAPLRLTPKQKGYLALRNFADPFTLLTVVGNSAFTIGIDAHTAYGPGLQGFGKNVGYSLLQDATGEFIGTFAVCSLFRQDPHYHRMPNAKPMRRIAHAMARTVIAQHDNGSLMPNYENFISYPASAMISNLYIPGVAGNLTSTFARILTGLATDPLGNLITEFIPDLAKRVRINVVFVQDIINRAARGE